MHVPCLEHVVLLSMCRTGDTGFRFPPLFARSGKTTAGLRDHAWCDEEDASENGNRGQSAVLQICDGDSRVYSPVPAQQSGHAGSGSTLQLPLWEHLPFV